MKLLFSANRIIQSQNLHVSVLKRPLKKSARVPLKSITLELNTKLHV